MIVFAWLLKNYYVCGLAVTKVKEKENKN